MYPWLQDAIAENAEIVTASRRLARELRTAHDESQVAAGKKSWLTPAINSWQDWLAAKLDDVADPAELPNRIDAFSALIIWERCLQQHIPGGFLSFAGIVRQTRRAWQLVCDWSVPVDDLQAFANSEDERLFARVAASYRDQLESADWVDDAALPALFVKLVAKDVLTLPTQIVLAGFDRLIPSVEGVINAIDTAGSHVSMAPLPAASNAVSIATFDNHDAELRSAGAWARDLRATDPTAKVAIVSPTLQNDAGKTLRLILEGLAPGWQRGGKRYSEAANVSYGRKLSEFPAIHVVILILKWINKGLTSREISLVLRSKSIGNGEIAGRCRLEYALRTLPDRMWSLSAFQSALRNRVRSNDVEQLFAGLRKMGEFAAGSATPAGPATWAGRIHDLLTELHWPGDQTLDSQEFQLVNRWRRLLNEFARTELVVQQMKLAEVVQRLTALAGETIYQFEATSGAVQVLGTLEAAGMKFDGIWVCGLDAAQWPPPGRPSPFLGRTLQQKFGMPDATPVDTLEFAQRVLDRLLASAPECVVSWSRMRDDVDLTVSPLLDDMNTTVYEGRGDPGWFAARYVGAKSSQLHTDDTAPPVTADEHIRGGAYTVQRQSIEPFAAFAYGRLAIRHPDAIEPGLSARARGIIIHDALRNLMAGNPSHAEICSWSGERQQQRIGSAVDAALSGLINHADPALRRILALERKRLRTIIDEFISRERQRKEFAVASVESEIAYERGAIHLGLRVDRIDQLEDGSLLIIDYKTGTPKSFLNLDGEPSDLQLVVYADALQKNTGGLSLVNIDSRLISYKGVGGSIEWDPDDGDNWNERLNAWRSLVHRAIDDFAAGDVRINLRLPSAQARALQLLSRQEELKRAD